MTKETGNVISDTLGAGEDDTLVGTLLHDLLEVLDHLVTLLEVGNNLNNLGNAVVGGKISGSNVDLDVIVQEVRSQLTDFLGPSGGPHASLTVRANLADDLANLRLETHVQHAVSLVENEVGNTAEVGATSLEHIDQTTGGSNADLDTTGEVTDLRTLGDTTVDTGVANAGGLSKLGDLGLNLNGQLTSGSKDEDNRAIARREEGLSIDVDNGGETVAQGLSGTSLGNTDDITTGEGHGPTLSLDSGGAVKALCLDLREDVLGETGLVESLNGAGNVVTLNGHDLGLAEGINLLLSARSNVGVLLVEGLFELGEAVEVWSC